MRILFDARTIQDHFPGIGRYVYNLTMALAPELNGALLLLVDDLTRTTQHEPRNTQYDLDILAHHPNVQLIPTDIPVRNWREQTHLPRLIHSLAPDLVHFPYYIRPYRLGIPSILTLYDVIPRQFPHYFSRSTALSIETLKRLAIRNSDAFVAISQATAEDFLILYGIPAGRITTTPLAPDSIFELQSSAVIAGLRKRMALPQRYALYLGSNKPHKNLPRLIEAWALVQRSVVRGQRSEVGQTKKNRPTRTIPDIQYPISDPGDESPAASLVIAGAWDERYPDAKQLVDTLGLAESVQFPGPINNADLPTLYAGAEFFVFPSLYEGFGLPVLEAMACGTPVTCSNTSSLSEVAGDAAILFDPMDVNGMAVAIQRLLADHTLCRTLSGKGREQASQFTWKQTARETLRAYETVWHSR